jgi:hypothetical protein
VAEDTKTSDGLAYIPKHRPNETTTCLDNTVAASRYLFQETDSDENEDLDIDLELETLSASIARMRRIAEEMGREIEIQNMTLARLLAGEAAENDEIDSELNRCPK